MRCAVSLDFVRLTTSRWSLEEWMLPGVDRVVGLREQMEQYQIINRTKQITDLPVMREQQTLCFDLITGDSNHSET